MLTRSHTTHRWTEGQRPSRQICVVRGMGLEGFDASYLAPKSLQTINPEGLGPPS